MIKRIKKPRETYTVGEKVFFWWENEAMPGKIIHAPGDIYSVTIDFGPGRNNMYRVKANEMHLISRAPVENNPYDLEPIT